MCERTIVLQKGSILERGDSEELFRSPKKNYTKELLAAIPQVDALN
jgi:peptide/nickel transport system ATP-binding protein